MRKNFFANGANGDLCKNLPFLVLVASGCLPVAPGPQSGFAKYLIEGCIICTWAPSYGFLWFLYASKLSNFHPLIFCAAMVSHILQIGPTVFFRFAPRCSRHHHSRDRHAPAWTPIITISHPSHAFWKASALHSRKIQSQKTEKTVFFYTIPLFRACLESPRR